MGIESTKGIKSIKGTKSIEGSKSIKGDMKRFEDLIKNDLFLASVLKMRLTLLNCPK